MTDRGRELNLCLCMILCLYKCKCLHLCLCMILCFAHHNNFKFPSIHSVAFLGAPLWHAIYIPPLPLNYRNSPSPCEIDFTESKESESEQLKGHTLCLFMESKRSWKEEGGWPLNFCYKKSLMLGRYRPHHFSLCFIFDVQQILTSRTSQIFVSAGVGVVLVLLIYFLCTETVHMWDRY